MLKLFVLLENEVKKKLSDSIRRMVEFGYDAELQRVVGLNPTRIQTVSKCP
jgi:hypothetical protein